MPTGTCKEISVSLQAVIYAVLQREEALMCSCPKMQDGDYKKAMRSVAKTERDVAKALQEFRVLTASRFDGFLDAEVILSCFMVSSIWHDARDLFITSSRMGDVIGRNHAEDLAELAVRLTCGTSPTLRFLRLKWNSWAQPSGQYGFRVHKPEILLRRIFGNEKDAPPASELPQQP